MSDSLFVRFGACVLGLCLVVSPGCDASKPETLIESGYDEQEMEAAIARAQAEVESFIEELANPTGEDHAVKAPVKDGEIVEHFWLTNLTHRDGKFSGRIGNEPGSVKNVTFGQPWTIAKEDITDWMFMRDDKLHGNYTMRPLLTVMPPAEAAKFRQIFAEP